MDSRSPPLDKAGPLSGTATSSGRIFPLVGLVMRTRSIKFLSCRKLPGQLMVVSFITVLGSSLRSGKPPSLTQLLDEVVS